MLLKKFPLNDKRQLLKDLFIGVQVAILSVPLSLIFAQVAGVPAQYGLYGSLFSMLIFGIMSSSPRMVVGVDAAPAALAGTLIAGLEIVPESPDAITIMPFITLLTSFWLLLFWLIKGGKLVRFVSEPVVGGCISGIATVVILSRIPCLFGSRAITGRAPILILHIIREFPKRNSLSLIIGLTTIVLFLICKKYAKINISFATIILGIFINSYAHLEDKGVDTLGKLHLESIRIADIGIHHIRNNIEEIFVETLVMALVIVAETLVFTHEIGRKYEDSIDDQREMLAYAFSNIAAALFGGAPVGGSISRTKFSKKKGVKSQWMSISAFFSMAAIIFFGSRYIEMVPLPILNGIFIATLISMIDMHTALTLWKKDKWKFLVFIAAFSVELLGLSEGVIVGVILSFISFTMRASFKSGCFLGCIEGEEGFFDLSQMPQARPIQNTIIFQFNENLFFANIDEFEEKILGTIDSETRLVIVTGLSGVDFLSTERVLNLYRKLKAKNIIFYLAGHSSIVNEQLIKFGAEELINICAVKPRLTTALSDGGLKPPYPLGERKDRAEKAKNNTLPEAFTWAYGKYARPRMEMLAKKISEEHIIPDSKLDPAKKDEEWGETADGYWHTTDEKVFLELLETRLEENEGSKKEVNKRPWEKGILRRRKQIERQLNERGDYLAANKYYQQDLEKKRTKEPNNEI